MELVKRRMSSMILSKLSSGRIKFY